jgi:chaperonin GroES
MKALKTTITTTAEDITKIIKPFHNRLMIRRDDAPKESKIAKLDIAHAREKPNTGIVLSLGAHCDPHLKNVKRIMFGRNAGTELTINDYTFLMMRDVDCFLDLLTMMPFQDKVLIRPDPMPKEIKGIIIPDNVNEQPQAGTVLAVGPYCLETVVGEKVLFGKSAGMFITPQEEELLIIREADLFAGL